MTEKTEIYREKVKIVIFLIDNDDRWYASKRGCEYWAILVEVGYYKDHYRVIGTSSFLYIHKSLCVTLRTEPIKEPFSNKSMKKILYADNNNYSSNNSISNLGDVYRHDFI